MNLDPDLEKFIEKWAAVNDDEWREYARCLDEPADLWFDSSRHQECAEACAVCPVRIECLDDSLRNDDGFFTRGGLTEDQRNKVVLHRRRYRSAFDCDLDRAFVAA